MRTGEGGAGLGVEREEDRLCVCCLNSLCGAAAAPQAWR